MQLSDSHLAHCAKGQKYKQDKSQIVTDLSFIVQAMVVNFYTFPPTLLKMVTSFMDEPLRMSLPTSIPVTPILGGRPRACKVTCILTKRRHSLKNSKLPLALHHHSLHCTVGHFFFFLTDAYKWKCQFLATSHRDIISSDVWQIFPLQGYEIWPI